MSAFYEKLLRKIFQPRPYVVELKITHPNSSDALYLSTTVMARSKPEAHEKAVDRFYNFVELKVVSCKRDKTLKTKLTSN